MTTRGIRAAVSRNLSPQDSLGGATLARTPRIEGDVGLAVVMGGTNVRCVLLGGNIDWSKPPIFKLAWEDYPEDVSRMRAASASERAEVFAEFFAEQAIEHFRAHGVLPHQIKRIGLSVPGQIETIDGQPLLTTCNTKVPFHRFNFSRFFVEAFNARLRGSAATERPESEEELHFSPIEVAGTRTLNDAQAGILGEALQGRLKGYANAVLLIIGTGVGGAGLKDGELDPNVWELGHTFLYDLQKGRFRFFPKSELESLGFLYQGKFLQPSYPYSYLEEHLAGPWVAARFIKSLAQDRQDFYELLNDDRFPVHEEALRQLDEIPYTASLHWGTELRDSAIKPVLGRLITTTLASDARASLLLEKSSLAQKTWAFKYQILKEVGLAIRAIRKEFPRRRIVLCGGFVEALSGARPICPEDTAEVLAFRRAEFFNVVKGVAEGKSAPVDIVASEMDGEVREALGALSEMFAS